MMLNLRKKAFTLIELMLVVGIIAVYAGAMIPMIQGARQRAQAAKIIQTADTLRIASINFCSDTGSYPFDYSNVPAFSWLTTDPGLSGWDGPYIDHPLTAEDASPGTGVIWVWAGMMVPFDLDGNGTADKIPGKRGATMLISAFPEITAQAINNEVDTYIPGDWRTTGKLRFFPTGGGIGNMYFYLISE
ncbi:MAG: prepilin-type N-terminal cleavage/methylation domain-containing protein [Candidatus Omnitrophica bacterium]|nr:prepilin-type N-terminal cleavage/methylation domain-containing protein [Candidatus Omnitrophota bacterium]